jgi:integrase
VSPGAPRHFDDAGEIEIFTPKELGWMLSSARPEIVPFVALGAFAGIRSREIQRLDWADINLATGYITVSQGKAKTRGRRIIPILPALRAWLHLHHQESGQVCPYANMSKQIVRLVSDVRKEGGAIGRGDLPAQPVWPATSVWRQGKRRARSD